MIGLGHAFHRPRRRELQALFAGLVLVGLTSAAAGQEAAADPETTEAGVTPDPWEPFNRAIFAFNDTLDLYFLEPIATGWDWLLPDFALAGIDNLFQNAAAPGRLVNDLLQGKPAKFGDDLGRFLVNTTFGIGGLFDPAAAAGLESGDEDFGQTLAVWGVPPGPYLVLPFFGPSNPRDAVGLAAGSTIASPVFYLIPLAANIGARAVNIVNRRALVLEDIAAERRAAFDFYAAVRNAAVSFRQSQVRDRVAAPEEEDEDLYYFDEDE